MKATELLKNKPQKQLHVAGLDTVRPLKGSYVEAKMLQNARWLLSLDPDRLLAQERKSRGLDTRDKEYYEGWGIYHCYYLHAVCNLYCSFKGMNEVIAQEAKKHALYTTEALLECWNKDIEDGTYLSYFKDHMNCKDVGKYSHNGSGIMYCIHKDIMNLILVYRTFGMKEALDGAKCMVDHIYEIMKQYTREEQELSIDSRRINPYFSEGACLLDAVLQVYAETADPKHLETAGFLRRSWFDQMFLEDDERMAWGMEHANTEIPYVEGLVTQYMLTGDQDALKIAREYMYNSYAYHELPQGSISGRSAFPDYQAELYNYPKRVFFHIMNTKKYGNVMSGESCCSHNLNRVAEKLLEVTPDVQIMDAWERRFVNAVLSQQNPDTGMFIYNLNLRSNAHKVWGYPEKSFWCCYGTGAQVFAALTTGAFYENENAAYACLYMPCEYTHRATGIHIVERTQYPDDGNIEFEFHGNGELSLFLRLPGWLASPATITMPDGEILSVDRQGELYEIHRNWKDNDVVTLSLPFALRYECMPDRHEYVSVTYGPNLEVFCGAGEQYFNGTAQNLLTKLEPTVVPGEFQADFQSRVAGDSTYTIKPLRAVKDETYSGYFLLAVPPVEKIADEILLDNTDSRNAHNLHGTGIHIMKNCGTTWMNTKNYGLEGVTEDTEILFDMTSDPNEEMILRLYLDGSANISIHNFAGCAVIPLFDLQVNHEGEWKTFCTKSMEGDYPNELYYENFVIPKKWTVGKEKLEIRLKARNFHEIPGVIDSLAEKIVLFSVPESAGTLCDINQGAVMIRKRMDF